MLIYLKAKMQRSWCLFCGFYIDINGHEQWDAGWWIMLNGVEYFGENDNRIWQNYLSVSTIAKPWRN